MRTGVRLVLTSPPCWFACPYRMEIALFAEELYYSQLPSGRPVGRVYAHALAATLMRTGLSIGVLDLPGACSLVHEFFLDAGASPTPDALDPMLREGYSPSGNPVGLVDATDYTGELQWEQITGTEFRNVLGSTFIANVWHGVVKPQDAIARIEGELKQLGDMRNDTSDARVHGNAQTALDRFRDTLPEPPHELLALAERSRGASSPP